MPKIQYAYIPARHQLLHAKFTVRASERRVPVQDALAEAMQLWLDKQGAQDNGRGTLTT